VPLALFHLLASLIGTYLDGGSLPLMTAHVPHRVKYLGHSIGALQLLQ
jgi:hypothetical protein